MPKDWNVSQEDYERNRQHYIEQGTLRCTVCESTIPPERIKKKANTCSPDCGKISKLIRRRVIAATREACLACGRPCNEQQRAEWLEWRHSRATRKRGRPKNEDKAGAEAAASGTQQTACLEKNAKALLGAAAIPADFFDLDAMANQVEATKAAITEMHRLEVGFEQARILLANRFGLSIGEASDRIVAGEQMAGIQLAR